MAKSKKSKILAMALCASVMTGIYASPVMADELWVNGNGTYVNNKIGNGVDQITSLEGLEEITLGDSVKITTVDKGIIRVGDAGGVNTRVYNDGFYINKTGTDQKTSLTAGTLTLAGNKLTSAQLVNIKRVIRENGVIKASTYNGVTLATDGNKVEVGGYNVAQMSKDIDDVEGKIGGIRRAGTTDENRSTYIEETVRVNNNSGLVVYAEDGKTFAAQIDREGNGTFTGAVKVDGNVLTEGVGRFGAFEGPNVRMENGVLTVNSTGETDVAKLDARGLTLTSGSGATEATLSAEQIARLNTVVTQNGESIVVTAGHFENANNSFAVDSNGAVRAADGKFNVRANGAVRAADGKFNVGANGAVRAADGKFNVGADGAVAIQYADNGAIVANENGFAVQKGSAQAVVTNDGVGLAAGLKADGSAAARISVTDDGIGLQGGTSKVVLNSNNGAVFTNGEGNGETVINGGSITTNRITTGTVNGVAIGMNGDGDITLGNNVVIDGDFNSDNIAGITRVDRNDSEPGSEVTYIEKNTAVSADGIVVKDPGSGVSTKTKYDGFYVKDKTGKNVSRLTKDRLELAGKNLAVADSEGNIDVSASTYTAGDATAENVRVKSDGIYVKNGSEILNSLTAEGLTLGKQQLTEEKIADIGGIDRSYDEETRSYTTTIEEVLSISDDGSFATTNGSFSVDAEGNLYSTNGTVTVQTRENLAAVQLGQTTLGMSDEDITMSVGRGTAIALSKYTGINLSSGGNNIALNSDGAVFTNDNIEGSTVIKGGSVTTGTITADDLHVDNIYLGNQIVDEEGNVVGSDLAIGADGSIKIADNFEVDTDNLAAHYGEYELTLDGNGFALGNSKASLTLTDSGYAFDGPVNLGKGSDVKYTGGNYDTLAKLDATVKDIYDRTDGIYKDSEGNTVISKEEGKWNGTKTVYEGEGSKVVVGDNGTTFVNGSSNGTTNIDGSKITSDADGTISGGSGPSTNSIRDPFGTSTSNGEETVYDAENGKNTNTVNSSGMTVTNGTSTTVIDAEKVDTKTGNFSDKVTVGIQDNQTVITGGDVTVDNRVTVGSGENQTIVNNDGVTVGGADGTSINHDEVRVGGKGGSYMNDTDVVSGEGVSLNQTAERVGHLENRVGKLEDRVDKVGAMAAAIANLRTMGYDPAAPTEVAVGIGQYRDETGAALGLFHYPNRDFMLSLSVSTSGDEVMGGIGATWKFGRKSPEKVAEIKKAQAEADVRRAEEAKLAKAEEMKQAAKEAKIKAQQERHAKLAAQAEAAK